MFFHYQAGPNPKDSAGKAEEPKKEEIEMNRDGEPMYLMMMDQDGPHLLINDPTLLISKEYDERVEKSDEVSSS